jgi:hypothetical protein
MGGRRFGVKADVIGSGLESEGACVFTALQNPRTGLGHKQEARQRVVLVSVSGERKIPSKGLGWLSGLRCPGTDGTDRDSEIEVPTTVAHDDAGFLRDPFEVNSQCVGSIIGSANPQVLLHENRLPTVVEGSANTAGLTQLFTLLGRECVAEVLTSISIAIAFLYVFPIGRGQCP